MSVSGLGGNVYRVVMQGTSGDGSIVLTISDVGDIAGNALTDNTVTYTGWWDTDWARRRKLTFDNSAQGEDLVDFPVLVRLSSARIDYGMTQGSGEDIRFVDGDRAVLKHEVEEWDESGDSWMWVKIPQIEASSNTDFIWMYYGNASASDGQDAQNVWDVNHVGVWHLNEGGTGTRFDSTSYGNNGTTGGYDGNEAITGKISGADNLDGINEYINVGSSASLDLGTSFTVSAWIKATALKNYAGIVGKDTNMGSPYSYMLVCHNNGTIGAYYTGVWNFSSNAGISAGNWYYLTWVLNGGNIYYYVNSLAYGLDSFPYVDDSNDITYFGSWYSANSNYDFNGTIDEIRISNTARSQDWISAQYLSMNDNFITFGDEE